nr:MAG TPA: hypothetical protein [Microviridae sp.]
MLMLVVMLPDPCLLTESLINSSAVKVNSTYNVNQLLISTNIVSYEGKKCFKKIRTWL